MDNPWIWLVVSTPLKHMKVKWDDESQYMETKKCSKPPISHVMKIINQQMLWTISSQISWWKKIPENLLLFALNHINSPCLTILSTLLNYQLYPFIISDLHPIDPYVDAENIIHRARAFSKPRSCNMAFCSSWVPWMRDLRVMRMVIQYIYIHTSTLQ